MLVLREPSGRELAADQPLPLDLQLTAPDGAEVAHDRPHRVEHGRTRSNASVRPPAMTADRPRLSADVTPAHLSVDDVHARVGEALRS
ncbi:hypothetical protein GCM10027519_38720 [Kineococcus endophyticus]